MSATERWLPVVGYEGIYEVSDMGRVKRVAAAQGTRVGMVLKPIEQAGYHFYNLNKKGAPRKRLQAHRLVLNAFVGPQPELLGLHYDDDGTNNRLDNLRWGTRLDNAADWKRNGIRTFPNQNAIKTHCLRGHPLSGENLKVTISAAMVQGFSRRCRECIRQRHRTRKLAV